MYTGSLKSIAASVGGSFTSVPLRNTACKAKGTWEPRDAWGAVESMGARPSRDVARLEDALGVESIVVGGDSVSIFGEIYLKMEAATVERSYHCGRVRGQIGVLYVCGTGLGAGKDNHVSIVPCLRGANPSKTQRSL
jgi:hypothetical protein